MKTKLKVARVRLLFKATIAYDDMAKYVVGALLSGSQALERKAIVASETCFLEENLEAMLEAA